MAVLFRYECKKLFSRRLVWIFAALCMGLFVFMSSGMIKDRLSGRVQGMRDVYSLYEGRLLTDALVTEAQMGLDQYVSGHPDSFTSFDDEEGHSTFFPNGYYEYDAGVWQGYMDVIQGNTVENRRQWAATLQKSLDTGHSSDGRPLPSYIRKVYETWAAACMEPAAIHYARGWVNLIHSQQAMGIISLFLLALGLTPLFSGERTARMDSILLGCARRKQAAMAKLLVSACYALMLFLLFYGLQLLVVALTYGLDGFSAPSSALIAWMPNAAPGKSIGHIFLMAGLVSLAALIASAAMAALASAVLRSHPAVSLMGHGAFIAIQMLLMGINNNYYLWNINLWRWIERLINLLPAVALGNSENLIMIMWNMENVAFGIALSLLLTGITLWLAPRQFLKQRKA